MDSMMVRTALTTLFTTTCWTRSRKRVRSGDFLFHLLSVSLRYLPSAMFYVGSNVMNWPLEAQRSVIDGHEICARERLSLRLTG